MKEVTAFVCEFCPRKKRFAAKGTAKRHEDRCFYNPARRACATCKNFAFEPHIYEHDTGYHEGGAFCALDLLIPATEESPERLRADCEGWEQK